MRTFSLLAVLDVRNSFDAGTVLLGVASSFLSAVRFPDVAGDGCCKSFEGNPALRFEDFDLWLDLALDRSP
jgi:hypothetical protein